MSTAWRKQPGEVYDSRGVPIYPGDLLRTPHYRRTKKKWSYLYHVAVLRPKDGGMRMVPASHLHTPISEHPDTRGGDPLLLDSLAVEATVIDGVSLPGILCWRDRPRKAKGSES